MATVMKMRVDVYTQECTGDDAYIYMLPEGSDPVEVTQAIKTLYGHEGVRRLDIEYVEVEEEDE